MAKSKTLTKANAAKLSKLRVALSAAMSAVYDVEKYGSNTPFSVCYEHCGAAKRSVYDKAYRAVWDFEDTMILQGRGWRNRHGHFEAY